MRRPRLVIADDHGLILQGVRRLLEPDFEIVGTVRDGRSLLKLVQDTHPELVLLDISMPLLNGMDAARQIRDHAPGTKIIFLTMHADQDYVIEAFRAGASGYLVKSSAEEELTCALRAVLSGGVYISRVLPEDLRTLPFRSACARDTGESGLSTREREVLQLVAEGRSAKEIAGILCISVKTVEYHKYRMMKRLGLHSSAELATYAARSILLGLRPPVELQSSDRAKRH